MILKVTFEVAFPLFFLGWWAQNLMLGLFLTLRKFWKFPKGCRISWNEHRTPVSAKKCCLRLQPRMYIFVQILPTKSSLFSTIKIMLIKQKSNSMQKHRIYMDKLIMIIFTKFLYQRCYSILQNRSSGF